MKKTIKLTEGQLDKLIRQTIAEQLKEDMNMDQYSEFNYNELAQHLVQDLADYGVIDGSQYYDEDKILLELPNEQYIYLDFDFNEDGSLYQVYIDTDETDKDIIKITGTPYHELYRLGKDEEFDYDTLLDYVKKILDIHNNAVATVGKSWNESVIHAVMENIKRKLNEGDGDNYAGDSLENFNFNEIAEYLADEVRGMMESVYEEEEYNCAYVELNFRDGSLICAQVDITLYSHTTYYWGGDYYHPSESSGYNTVSIDDVPIVSIYGPDGTQWDEEEVNKLSIDWTPLDKVADEEWEW